MSGDPISVEHPGPLLRVVRGDPTDEELAALVVALAASRPAAAEPEPARPSAWATYERTHHRTPHPGPGAWRFSLR